jgi:hypothetical protein
MVEDVFIVRVEDKTVEHPFFGMGFPKGYLVDGIEGKELNLLVNRSYVFYNTGNCGNSLFISTNVNGSLEGIRKFFFQKKNKNFFF